eukprot:6689802-Pyramimonas_sp.AAC.1
MAGPGKGPACPAAPATRTGESASEPCDCTSCWPFAASPNCPPDLTGLSTDIQVGAEQPLYCAGA